MDTRQKLHIDYSEIGFRRYIRFQRSYIDREIENFETFNKYVGPDWNEYCVFLKIKDLDNRFISCLNNLEKEVLKYIHYHNPNENEPCDCYQLFKSSYDKWISIFYKEYNLTFCDINQRRLGTLMKNIRTSNNLKMTELARAFDVDVSCVSLYESGQRLPNLNYIKNFAYLFSISIDDLVNNSLEDTLYSSLSCNIQSK